MITMVQAAQAIRDTRVARQKPLTGPLFQGPWVVLSHFPDGRTEWRDDQGGTGLFRTGVGLRAYPPHQSFLASYTNVAAETLRRYAADDKYHLTFFVPKRRRKR